MTAKGIDRLPRPVIAADEQQWLFIEGLLADAAQWYEDRINACGPCGPCASGSGEDCPDHRADVAQIYVYAQPRIGPFFRSVRDVSAGDTAIIAAAASNAAAYRRSRPGADDQALAAGYEELGRQLSVSAGH